MKIITWKDYSKRLDSKISIGNEEFLLGKPVVSKLEPDSFDLENTTVYQFPKRGDWATHYLNTKFRGNFAPQIARNMIYRYSKKGETILDPMCGSGTTMVECKLLKRNGVGIDVNLDACYLTANRLDFGRHDKSIKIYHGDVRSLDCIADESVDLIITHPPYGNILRYSNLANDLSSLSLNKFKKELPVIAKELFRVLKSKRYCAVLIGDTRKSGKYIPLSHYLMNAFLEQGFSLKEDIIKTQFNCKMTPFWSKLSKEKNFHLIMHEHLFVFVK